MILTATPHPYFGLEFNMSFPPPGYQATQGRHSEI